MSQEQEQKKIPIPALTPEQVGQLINWINQIPTLYGKEGADIIQNIAIQNYEANLSAPMESPLTNPA